MAASLYKSLIRNFLKLAAPDNLEDLNEEPGILHLRVDPFTCSIIPLVDNEQIVLQCPVADLKENDSFEDKRLLRLLHGLNWIASLESGIVVLVDETDHAILHKILKIKQTTPHRLEQEIAAIFAAANDLQSLLKRLPVPEHDQPNIRSNAGSGIRA